MQYIYDPISKSVTITSDDDAVILKGPFKNKREALHAAKTYNTKTTDKTTDIDGNSK